MTRYAEGFTTAVDLAFGPDGSLYVVELRGVLGQSGIAVSHESLYVANCGVCAGTGEVRRYDL